MGMRVEAIDAKLAYPWLLEKHYANRLCPISWAFALYDGETMVGVVTYGTPVSSPLRLGVCGPVYADHVLELNRLVINSIAPTNAASFLVSHSLRMLPRDMCIVSFADIGQGHIGYVYQAANFLYTGLSAKRTDWKLEGHEELHGATVADMSRGVENRAAWMKQTFGNGFYLKERTRKHRYVYFTGKKIAKALKYPVLPYPKGDSRRYDCKDIRAIREELFP
jgi:hypothetical protein